MSETIESAMMSNFFFNTTNFHDLMKIPEKSQDCIKIAGSFLQKAICVKQNETLLNTVHKCVSIYSNIRRRSITPSSAYFNSSVL